MSEEQKKKLSQAHKGRVFSEEHKRNLSKAHKGQIPSNLEQLRAYRKGRPLTDEHKRKIGEAQKGKSKNYSKEALRKMREASLGRPAWNKGKTNPKLCGENNPNWIKDRSKVKKYKKRLGSLYTQWRRKCHIRDNYSCRLKDDNCNGKLEVHHIKRWIDNEDLRYDVNNGITLCHHHHPRAKHKEKELESLFTSLIS